MRGTLLMGPRQQLNILDFDLAEEFQRKGKYDSLTARKAKKAEGYYLRVS
jgi:hypothetical protein